MWDGIQVFSAQSQLSAVLSPVEPHELEGSHSLVQLIGVAHKSAELFVCSTQWLSKESKNSQWNFFVPCPRVPCLDRPVYFIPPINLQSHCDKKVVV